MNAMLLPLVRYGDFRRRATRSEYWLFALFLFVASAFAVALDNALGTGGGTATVVDVAPGYWASSTVTHGGWITRLFWLAMLIPLLAVSVRRLHDIGRSGFWLLLVFVPAIGWLVLLVFDLTDGQRGPNRWGDDPKEVEADARSAHRSRLP